VYFLDSRNFLKPTFIHYILTKRTSWRILSYHLG
jgi:hypothetical protein